VPHPIAAGNRLEGETVKGGACAIAVATRPEGAPLTGLLWRANDHQWRGLLGLAIRRLVSYAGGMRYPCDVRSHVRSESVEVEAG
jgi:hypothetical protein